MPIDDEDLFDAPRPKPSNKIVYQPPGAQWSLDRLGEVESLYQTSFKKKLPLINRGQGSIHNKWGYDHRNSADVSINPSTPEGQRFIEELKKANVPFLAFSGAIPGVATGPHVHIGFPSARTQKKFGIGAQKKSRTVASDDLFDTDDDLFDQSSEQIPPSSSVVSTNTSVSPKKSKGQSSAPLSPLERALGRMPQAQRQRVRETAEQKPARSSDPARLFRQLGQQRTVDQLQREQENHVGDQVREEIRGRTGPYGNPTGTGILHLLANPVGSFTGLLKSEDEKVAEETAERIKAQRLAETPEVTKIRKEYGAMPAAERAVVAPLARGGAGLLSAAGGIASAFGIAPNRLSEWANKRAAIIEAGAGNAPLREKRGLSSLITGQTELEEVERGVPEKIATGIADLGVGLGQIILLQKATKLPFNQLLALEAAAKNNDKPIEQQLGHAAEGYALGSALQSHLGKGANAALFGIPTAAQTGYEVSQGRMSPLDAAIQTGIQAGAGAILTPKKQGAPTREAERPLTIHEPDRPRLAEDPKFKDVLMRESIGGNAGPGRAAVNMAVDAEGRVVAIGNRQDLPAEVRAGLDDGSLRNASAVVKYGDDLDNPQVEKVVFSTERTAEPGAEPRDVTPEWSIGRTEDNKWTLRVGGKDIGTFDTHAEADRRRMEIIPDVTERRGTSTATKAEATNPVPAPSIDTAAELDRAENAFGQQHSVAKFLSDSPLRDKVLKELPDGSRLAGPNEKAPEMQTGAVRLRAPNGAIWEVDLAYDHARDPSWKIIGDKMGGFAVRKTGEKTAEPVPKIEQENPVEPTSAKADILGEAPRETFPTGEASPQRYYHRDFGEVIKTADQSGARAGRTRVQEANDAEKIHYVKTAQLTGAGNQRMVPVKGERLVTGERSDTSLSQFVRKEGGIVPAEMYKGELDRLRRRETGTSGLINQNARQGDLKQTADIMMQAANDAGFRDKNGQPFENPGDFLRAVERDVAGEKTYSTLRDTDAEIEKGLASYYADQQKAIDAEVARTEFLESGRGAELFDKIRDRKASDAEHQELIRLAEERGISRAEVEDIIAGSREEVAGLEETSPARPTDPAEQLGFVQEGLTQESALPPKLPDQRARLVREEQDRQAALNPERTAAQAKLEEIRRRGMTVEDYARQPDLTGNVPDAKELRLLRELERGSELEPSQQRRLGEEGFLNVSPEKVEYKPATTPVLKDVERATMEGENKRPSLRQFARRAASYHTRALIAEFTPLRELEATLYGKDKVPVVNLARKFEQVAGAPAKAQADIIDFRRAVIDPIRKSADDFNSFLFLKRVEDRLLREPERKRVAEWTIEKARQGLAELKAKVGDETYKQLERAGNAYQKEMDKALRLQVESGRMSEELYDQIINSRDFYAPFKVLRHIEESDFLKGSGRRVATTQELSKKITGIDSEDFQLGNILQASAEQIVRSRILAEKNLKMLELDKLADLDPRGDLIRRVEGDERPRQGYEFVRFLKDGKEQALEVEHVVADAVQGLNPKQTSLLARAMAMARKPLQLGATSANAGFQAVNLFFADLPRQALVSRYGVRSPKDIYQFPLDWSYSLMTSMKGNFGKPNQLYMDWLRSGAANSTIQRELTPESFRPTLGIAKPGIKHLGRSVIDSVAKFSNAIEETSKILGLKRGMKAEEIAKMSPAERRQAMEKIAVEVRNYSGSPDFARKGSETRELNLLFMFFNARLQGLASDLTRLAGRTGKREAVTAWARLGTVIGIPTTILAVLNNSPQYKDDYDKIPDWEKKSYWMIPRESYFKNEDTGEMIRDYWRIPKRELGQLFGNTIESAVEFGYKHDPKTAKQWGVDMLENISPINIQGKTTGERAESAFSGLNPALKLPAELIMNRDTFRHRDIVPDYMSKAAPAEQYRESTSRPYRAAGRALGVSPLQLEHLTEGATGSAASQFSIRPQPEGRSSLAGYPVFRRFFRSGATAQDDSLTQAQQDAATKQLQRRRERQDAIKKYRAGQISKEELDRLEQEDRLTESDVKRVEKEAGMTPRQVAFYNRAPVDALAAYERMTPAQQEHVKDIMARKAYTLLNSEALTDAQKEAFKARIEQLGISPEAPRRQSSNPFSQRFRSTFK